MQIVKIKTIKDVTKVFQIWNDEYGYIFPISKELFERNLENAYEDTCLACVEKDEVIGFIIGKIWQDKTEVKGYENFGWLSLIYVTPSKRKQGIGSELLKRVESIFRELGKTNMHLGRDCHNFFPGLPYDFSSFKPWFEKRGFVFSSATHDLINYDTKTLLPIKNESKGYTFRLGRIEDKDAILAFLSRVWPGRWTQEAIDYFDHGGNGKEYLIGLNNKLEIIGFSKVVFPTTLEPLISYGTTWRSRFEALGGIGPLGVDPAYRGRDLGYDIVASACNILKSTSVSHIIIDWTGLLEFYRHMGFEVWKSYIHASKELN